MTAVQESESGRRARRSPRSRPRRIIATALLAAAAMAPLGCERFAGELAQAVLEPFMEALVQEAFTGLGEAIQAAYSQGDISVTAGGVFAHGDAITPGGCAELQVRGYCSKNVAFDMGVLALTLTDADDDSTISGTMFTVALGGATDMFVAAGKQLPFRVGLSALVATPVLSESNGSDLDYDTMAGAKIRIDWIPIADWRDPWASGILEAAVLAGAIESTPAGSGPWDTRFMTMVRGGVQFSW